MNPILEQYPVIHREDDLVYTPYVAYQPDREQSVEYGKDYFEKYVGYQGTPLAKRLNAGRVELATRDCRILLDVGIGSGEFIESCSIPVLGYDINPYGVRWLKERGLYVDIYRDGIPSEVEGLTLWDALEHIPDHPTLFALIWEGLYLFVSLPTFSNLLNLKNSKHFRPNEHYYYFSKPGLIRYLADWGFECLQYDDREVRAGRENITTFVFRRTLRP